VYALSSLPTGEKVMPVESEWFHNGRVMVNTYSGRVTSADMISIINEHTEHALNTPDHIHVIADTRQITSLPVNILGLLQRDASKLRHVEKGAFVVVTQNRPLIAILNAFASIVPGTEFRFVRTMDEAWKIVTPMLEVEEN
jgi:hypothetical protein